MFLVEKDNTVDRNQTLVYNVTTSSITNFIDTDRHKFETFADALWWGIVCFGLKFFFRLKLIFFVLFL
jgi:hypothetical protein